MNKEEATKLMNDKYLNFLEKKVKQIHTSEIFTVKKIEVEPMKTESKIYEINFTFDKKFRKPLDNISQWTMCNHSGFDAWFILV